MGGSEDRISGFSRKDGLKMEIRDEFKVLFWNMAKESVTKSQYQAMDVITLLDQIQRFTENNLRGRKRRLAVDYIRRITFEYEKEMTIFGISNLSGRFDEDYLADIYTQIQSRYTSIIARLFGLDSIRKLYFCPDYIKERLRLIRDDFHRLIA